jgi:hypothetical protein
MDRQTHRQVDGRTEGLCPEWLLVSHGLVSTLARKPTNYCIQTDAETHTASCSAWLENQRVLKSTLALKPANSYVR